MDHYEVLGVSRDASKSEIGKAYKNLAKKYHPDANFDEDKKESTDKFKEVVRAYEVLNDPDKRARYDRFGDSQGAHFSQANYNNVFSFGSGFGGPRRPKNLITAVSISLEEVATGVSKIVEFKRPLSCTKCKGEGALNFKSCKHCQGKGRIIINSAPFAVEIPCEYCGASGRSTSEDCKDCKGVGFSSYETATVEVKIPAGIENHMKLRVRGEGEPYRMGFPATDLHVVVKVPKHPIFFRDGENLACEFPVTYTQLVLGDKIEVPSLTGMVDMKIPRGTQTGSRMRLQGLGLPSLHGGVSGDLFIIVKLETPTNLSKEHLKIIKKLADLDKKMKK